LHQEDFQLVVNPPFCHSKFLYSGTFIILRLYHENISIEITRIITCSLIITTILFHGGLMFTRIAIILNFSWEINRFAVKEPRHLLPPFYLDLVRERREKKEKRSETNEDNEHNE